ncbi:MAG: type II toxin-antitoxin system VapC family toxin [Chloroflexi bacterium]|nr:type II toxin-antitoxin system VapC family toxin [Chloroflexota bacterium]
MNGQVIVDASLAAKWLVNEVHSEKALALALSWARVGVQPVAPYLMPVEVANALYQRVVRAQMSLDAAIRLLEALVESGIQLREPSGLHRRSIELAAQLHQDAAYDSHYLALAEQLDCDLWTADERFYRAARPVHGRMKWLGDFEG